MKERFLYSYSVYLKLRVKSFYIEWLLLHYIITVFSYFDILQHSR